MGPAGARLVARIPMAWRSTCCSFFADAVPFGFHVLLVTQESRLTRWRGSERLAATLPPRILDE